MSIQRQITINCEQCLNLLSYGMDSGKGGGVNFISRAGGTPAGKTSDTKFKWLFFHISFSTMIMIRIPFS